MKKKYIIPILIIILILLLTTSVLLIYTNNIKNLTTESTLNNLGELTTQDAEKIENTIQEHIRILETITNEIEEEKPQNEEQLFKIYERNSGKTEFSRMAILYEDGKTTTSDGGIVDLSDEKEEFFKTDEIQISRSRKSKVDEEEINIYSKKINWLKQNVVVMLVVETNKYEEMFTKTIYNGRGIECIVTSSGEIIANSRNEKNGENIFDGLEKANTKITTQNEEALKMMKSQISQNEKGQITYKIENQKYYIAYQNLGEEKWNLVIITPESIAETLNKVLQTTITVSIIIILIVLVISSYIVVANIRKKERVYKLAYIDTLTGLGNKNYFKEQGEKFLKEHKNPKYMFILDIDKFKSFNQKYGHETGDKLLKEIGKKLLEILGEDCIICRESNDIFAILMETKKPIRKVAEDLCSKLEKVEIDNVEYIIVISLGIYKIKNNGDRIQKIIDKALIAHSIIKGNYHTKYNIYDENDEKQLSKEHEIEENMEKAIDEEEFLIYYQPKIDLEKNKMTSAEALVRWEKDGKIIPPDEFIPVFEKNQFIIKLDIYIFEKVCKDLAEWKKIYGKIPLVSINVSKEHFIKNNFISEYISIAKKYKLSPEEIELEITESATVDKNIDIIKIVENIKKAGFIVSIDDFGTGYSSLNLLQDLPIDTIKIDKTFIDKIDFKENANNLVDYIILIAKKRGLKTVAEGVESIEQIEYLKKMKCNLIQGYYYSKPLKKKEFEEYMNNNM